MVQWENNYEMSMAWADEFSTNRINRMENVYVPTSNSAWGLGLLPI